MIVKNTSTKTVELKMKGGGRAYLGPFKSINSNDIENLQEVEDRVKIVEDLTEVNPCRLRTDLSEVCHRKGQSING
ncbi:MAG: hypothetical protein ACTSO3_16935 [Candidatus Heimdallarchaeaceae archaeon]